MAERAVRRVVAALCVACLAAMIVAAITRHVGAVVAIGLVTTGAVACLMVSYAVAPSPDMTAPQDAALPSMRDLASAVEERIAVVAAATGDDGAARELARFAVSLGRALPRREPSVEPEVDDDGRMV